MGDTKESGEASRREFMRNCEKVAVVAPAVALVLSAAARPSVAKAAYSGGNGGGRGGGNGGGRGGGNGGGRGGGNGGGRGH